MQALPRIDEHEREIDASPAAVWDAVIQGLPGTSEGRGRMAFARILGAQHSSVQGQAGREGSELVGFRVARSDRPHLLVLEGAHRFSRYQLTFRIEARGQGSALRAETRAAFPGLRGRAYRLLVIGSRAHVVVVKRLLDAVALRAERAKLDGVSRPKSAEGQL